LFSIFIASTTTGICPADTSSPTETGIPLTVPFRGDLTSPAWASSAISQAESEVFIERILEANPGCGIIEANGLTGKGNSEFAKQILSWPERPGGMTLLTNPPLADCTFGTVV